MVSVDVKPKVDISGTESSRDCVSEEVSGVLSVPNKPSGFCGRKAVFTYLLETPREPV